MKAERNPSGLRRLAYGALLGAATTAGWLLNDLAVFMTSGQPAVFLTLLPGSLVALAVGTLLGALAGRFPMLLAAYLAAGLAGGLAPAATDRWLAQLAGTHALGLVVMAYLGTALSTWTLALLLAHLLHRALGLPAARSAACLGLGAAMGAGHLAQDEPGPNWLVLAGAALGILLLGSKRVPYRRLATAAVILGTTLFAVKDGLPETRVSYWRDDLAAPSARAAEMPNLLLVVLDTVRAQNLAPYGSERVTTPQLDAWVRAHATIFTQSRSTSSFTLASHGSLFTGQLPAQHRAARLRPSSAPLSADHPTLAERLRGLGFQTGAIAANFTYLNPLWGMDRGFERFDFRKGAWIAHYLALAQLTGRTLWAGRIPYRDARSITNSALDWLDRRREADPFFLMLNYLDAHTPYLQPAPHNMEFEAVPLTNPFGIASENRELAYDRCLHYLDSQVGRLLAELERRDLLETTLIVITSDHGESFGERNWFEHCWTLYENVVKVPLYLKPPGGRHAERDERMINSADVMWLMLDELGVAHEHPPAHDGPAAEWYRQIPMTERYLAAQENTGIDLDRDLLAWIEDGRKLIVSTHGEVEAFDLTTDPKEQHALVLTQDEIERAVERANAWWTAHPLPSEQTEEISADEFERLQALGYVGQDDE